MRRHAAVEAAMRRLGVDEALVGDLLEHRAAGGSAIWFWWQALGAIAEASAATIRSHQLLALRALLVGAAALWLLRMATVPTADEWSRVFGVGVGNYLLESHQDGLRAVRGTMVLLVAVVLAVYYGYGVAQLVRAATRFPGAGYYYTVPSLIALLLIPSVVLGGLWRSDVQKSEV